MKWPIILLGLLLLPTAYASPTVISASVTADQVSLTEVNFGDGAFMRLGTFSGKLSSRISWDGPWNFNSSLTATGSGHLQTAYEHGWQASGLSAIGLFSTGETVKAKKWLGYSLKAFGEGMASTGYVEVRGWSWLVTKYDMWGKYVISFNVSRIVPVKISPNITRPNCPAPPV
ncbi:MAG: hypothetical protein DRO09_02195 [Thermoprotei archaeon]|nr:MAG: hypothetical protein DRO09_02195 [Thermoprotei archaeon]